MQSFRIFLVGPLILGASLTGICRDGSGDHDGTAQPSAATRPAAETTDTEGLRALRYHLSMYQKMLEDDDKSLQQASADLMKKVNYAELYMLGYVARGALDGLSLGWLIKGATAGRAATAALSTSSTVATTRSAPVQAWLVNGGWESLKGLVKSGSLSAASGVASYVTLPKYELQFAVPIWGSTVLANRFSKQLFSAPETLDRLGDAIIQIRREKFRVRAAIEDLDNRIRAGSSTTGPQ